MDVSNLAGLGDDQLRAIEEAVAQHQILDDVLRWGRRQMPPREIVDVVVQDEFSHDVIFPYEDGLYLVYGTT